MMTPSAIRRFAKACLVMFALSTSVTPVSAKEEDRSSSSNDEGNKKERETDLIFAALEQIHGERLFGNLLDAGTGKQSLGWIARLSQDPAKDLTQFTAITADEGMQARVQALANELQVSDLGEILIGNWFGREPLDEVLAAQQKQYDTIIMDYLIGAMDGFSPYKQDLIIPKMAKLLKPGGRLYIIGLDPIPDTAKGDANIICKVRKVRDACILLAGHKTYREYPGRWVQRQIKQHNPDLDLLETRVFPINYKHSDIVRQINVARNKLELFPTKELADEMKAVLDSLEEQSRKATEQKGIRLGHDYLISAEKKRDNPKTGSEQEPEL
mmetsp:Transcript_15157/g.41935  ORF Transcript_15157/g.41935 Transcript_15157/m.41935 type:complete len:327 (-) Transcript_15157:1802-2782(-)